MMDANGSSLPTGYPVELWETAFLSDGTAVAVRPIMPADAQRLERLFYRLSPLSLYRRFFTPITRPDVLRIEHLVTVDYRDRLALVAVIDDEVVGVARYDRLPAGPAGDADAEAALIVEDAWQGRGIGTRLLWRLSAAARARGVTGFVAGILAENRPMMGLLEVMADEVETALEGTEYQIRVRLSSLTPPA